ncbi:MAG: hypothetical protein ACRDRD_15175, partial [Pseudonocardiaceae bacterium]
RAENNFLPVDYQTSAMRTEYGRAIDEQITYLHTGLDGLFTDQADISVTARTEYRTRARRRAAGHASSAPNTRIDAVNPCR